MGPVESFQQQLAEHTKWIQDLVKFVQYAQDIQKYNKMEATIKYVLKVHD